MKEKGFRIDPQINGAIVKDLKREKLDKMLSEWALFCKSLKVVEEVKDDVFKGVMEVILGADWSEEVESKLKKLKFPFSDDFLFRVIWELRDEPLKSLKFFKFVESYLNYKHNSVTYGGMARVLARGGLMSEFWDLLMEMRNMGCDIDNDTYNKITRCVGNLDGVKLFEFMMDGPYKLSEQECVWLLKNLSHEIDLDMNLATRIINKYMEVGNGYTKSIYVALHRILCKLGRFDEAKKIVEDMKKEGHKPDNITYSQEIDGLSKCGRFEDALAVLRQMETEECIPDIKTWTILIQQYCLAGHVDRALSCFAELMEKYIHPDAVVLKVLVEGFLSHDKILGAYKFLVEMVEKGQVKPWQVTYKRLIEMLLREGKLEEAYKLLSMMKEHNYRPYPEPFVKYISKNGTVKDAEEMLRALTMKGSPSTKAYVKVISSFFEEVDILRLGICFMVALVMYQRKRRSKKCLVRLRVILLLDDGCLLLDYSFAFAANRG